MVKFGCCSTPWVHSVMSNWEGDGYKSPQNLINIVSFLAVFVPNGQQYVPIRLKFVMVSGVMAMLQVLQWLESLLTFSSYVSCFIMDACLICCIRFNSSILSWEERLRNDLFCVGWDVKPQLSWCCRWCTALQSEIEQSLPSSKPTASLEGHPAVNELRQLMSQIDEIRQRRDSLETQLKDVPCDMSKNLLRRMWIAVAKFKHFNK